MKLVLRHCVQYVAATIAAFMYISTGTPRGWIAPMVPRLMANESHIRCSADQVSWIVSSRSLGIVVCTLLLFLVSDRVGRKFLLLASCVPSLAGWLVVIFATSCEELIVARVLDSVAATVLYIIPSIYISEISRDEVRGFFAVVKELLEIVGDLTVTTIAPYVSYTVLALVPATFPVVGFLAFLWMPESPYYCLLKNRSDQAEDALRRLRGVDDVSAELLKMQRFVDQRPSETRNPQLYDLFTTAPKRRAFLIGVVLMVAMMWTGAQVLGEYKTLIFRLGNTEALSADLCATILLVVQLVSIIVTMLSVDRFGRRPLLITSCVLCGVALTTGAVSFQYYSETSPAWLPIVWTGLFKLGFACGTCSLPWTVCAEIFPAELKGLAVTVLSLWVSVLAAVSLKTIPVFIGLWGVSSVLWCNVAVLLLTLAFTVSCVPETKAKHFAEIQEELTDASRECCSCFKGRKFDLSTGIYFRT